MGTKRTTKSLSQVKPQLEPRLDAVPAEPSVVPPQAASTASAPPPADAVMTADWLKSCGDWLEEKPPLNRRIGHQKSSPEASTWREYLMWALLNIRDKNGRLRKLTLNRAQRDLEATSTQRNIVLKARQLGVTTYVAARFFINCITREGTLSVQVAHDQRSAEEIFRIVHRLLDNLPEALRQGALVTSRANVRQIVFPMLDSEYRVETAADPNAGRGLTIQNLHCSEVARWPRDVSETLASLRAAVPPDGEIFLESTPTGAGGKFYDEWQRAAQTGYTRHFYPWWWDANYRRKPEIVKFTEEEIELMREHGLDGAQIAFRREIRANFRNRAKEEYAEDPESCFLASGDCVFDSDIVAKRLKQPAAIAEESDAGRLLTFFPPIPGSNGIKPKQYIVGVDPAGGGTDGDYACVADHRSVQRRAVRRVARTLPTARVSGSGCHPGAPVQRCSGRGRAQQSRTRGFGSSDDGPGLHQRVQIRRAAGLADQRGVTAADAGELRGRFVRSILYVSQPAAAGGMPHVHSPYRRKLFGRRRRARRHRHGDGDCPGRTRRVAGEAAPVGARAEIHHAASGIGGG